MLDEIVFEDAKRPNTVSGQSIESVPHIEEISIVGSVVECSPATRAARVRFPDDAGLPFGFFLKFATATYNSNRCFDHTPFIAASLVQW